MDTQNSRGRVLHAYPHGPNAVVALVVAFVSELGFPSGEPGVARSGLGDSERGAAGAPADRQPQQQQTALVRWVGREASPQGRAGSFGTQDGGQPGHGGHTLTLVDGPDAVVVHPPARCHVCGQSLHDIPAARADRPLGKAGSLVERLREHKGVTLAVMEDFAIAFDNSQAERDPRIVKIREKVSDRFRMTKGAEQFWRIRG